MKFLGNVLATIVGLFVFTMIFFFGLLIIGAAFGGKTETVSVESNSVIELDLSTVTNDYAGKFNYKEFDFFDAKHDGLFDIIKSIEEAKTDEKIKGISILNNQSELGIAQLKALRDALEDFKKSGKFVYAYSNSYSQREYYLNSVANKVYLNPMGDFEWKGLSAEVLFFKDFQEQTGLKMEIIRHGKYKSAVEPFLENKMSDPNREQMTALLQSVWSAVVNDVSKSRNIPVATLNQVALQLAARTPEMAKQQKLIDVVAYEDSYHDDIRKLLKLKKDEKYDFIKIVDYAENSATSPKENKAKDKIAVIYAQGEIGSGEGDIETIGEKSMNRSLKEAREDENVKAIVLRINSPGGSALTSELIWREIELTKKTKPVVVSMGNYAASGGYYIACNANTIFAEANTITGSIGVFGMLPNFSEFTNKNGIHADEVHTHDNAAEYSVFKPIDARFKMITQESVERIYSTFVNRVATGRKMNYAQVDAIGQGRVWSGSEALKIGLVDKIGGLDDALAEAARLSKIKSYKTKSFPQFEKDFEAIFDQLGLSFAKSKEEILIKEIGVENYRILEQIRKANQRKGMQAVLPFEFVVR